MFCTDFDSFWSLFGSLAKIRVSMFLALVSKTAPRGLQDVPRPPKRNDFFLELYLLLLPLYF